LETVAADAPADAVAINTDTALAGIYPGGGAVHDGNDKNDRVTSLEVDFDGAFPTRSIQVRVAKIGFMTRGNDHGRAITGSDVIQGEENIRLAAMKALILDLELATDHGFVAAW